MAIEYGPERLLGQGLDHNQEESGNRAILALLRDQPVADQVDLVITYRDGAYEVWSGRGLVRFRRWIDDGRLRFEVIEVVGENPIAAQDHTVLLTCADELRAAAQSGHPTEDPNSCFIEPAELTYPHAYERIAQLFDSPNAPDLVVSPKAYAFGLQIGQHGALDVVQSRAPLAFAGPRVRPGNYWLPARHVDVAPTICALMDFPLVDGCDVTGRRSSERGAEADVYLARQDGNVLADLFDRSEAAPERAYLIVFDGLSNSELQHLLDTDDPAIRNLRRILDRSARLLSGSIVNFPSITWPSHSTLLSGTWCGHHDIVNPAYYLRERHEAVAPQAQGMMTETYLGPNVETLYEAFNRVYGSGAVTAAIHEPQGRGAVHAALERRVLGSRDRLKALTAELTQEIHPRYAADGKQAVVREAMLDARGLGQVQVLFDDPSIATPVFVAHEFAMTDGAAHDYGPHSVGARTAIEETDARLGRVLDLLEAKGLLESTLFIFTADHGMACQDVALRANPARHPERIGLKAATAEPMIWLRDLAVTVEAAPDGRTARVIVLDHDAAVNGDERPVEGAEVLVTLHRDDRAAAHGAVDEAAVLVRIRTNELGIAGFTTPVDVPAAQIALAVRHADYNARHLRLDGRNLAVDLRAELYATA